MYNRYIPADGGYAPVPSAQAGATSRWPPPAQPSPPPRGGQGLLDGVKRGLGDGLEGIRESLGGLLRSFHGGELDLGDVLLALIVLFLILEDGDNLDVIITLGLMILFSLGEKKEEE